MWGMKGFLEEIKRIKRLVLKKVKQLMLMDYTKFLLANKKHEEIKINQRIVDVMNLLINKGPAPFVKFQSSPEMVAIYRNISPPTKYRDLKKMEGLRLVKLSNRDNKAYIEANFSILDYLTYNV